MSLSRGAPRAEGTICSRSSWVGACRDTARRTEAGSPASIRREIPRGTAPTVDMVTGLAPRPKSSRSVVRSLAAATTPSWFSSGSPMPMKTTLWMSLRTVRASRTCSRISPASRLRMRPNVPVAQNWQPMRQPAWDDRQSVAPGRIRIREQPLNSSSPPWLMTTASTSTPSCSATSNFTVPSGERTDRRIEAVEAVKSSASQGSEARGSEGSAGASPAASGLRRRWSQMRFAWLPLKPLSSSRVGRAGSSSGRGCNPPPRRRRPPPMAASGPHRPPTGGDVAQ
mmetsp:Transcript_34580/g.107963  ORF Transcript_34580/g.107963 Transcript_34580/m.107963 type:complete len:283 (+) Transcript_34580:658-1506(+)